MIKKLTTKEQECEDRYDKWRQNLTKKDIEEILSDHWGDFIC